MDKNNLKGTGILRKFVKPGVLFYYNHVFPFGNIILINK